MTWNNTDQVHWRIYAALGGDELAWIMMLTILHMARQYYCIVAFVTII